jgi:hypothetical protein
MKPEKLEGLLIDAVTILDNGMQLELEDGTIIIGQMFIVEAPAKPAAKAEDKKPAAEDKKP